MDRLDRPCDTRKSTPALKSSELVWMRFVDATSSFDETGHLARLTTMVVEECLYERELVVNHGPRYLESNMRSMLEALVEAQ